MKLAATAIERSKLTNFFVFLIFVGGIFAYLNLGRLEDPNFTVKTGVIFTQYPGASPEEVEQEVTDRIETAIQEMPQVDNIYSLSKAGLSIIKVDMKETYWGDALPQVWDEMRKKIRDIKPMLPVTANSPEIVDDFSFVYGFVLAVTGDGYSYAELEEYAKAMKKELSLVDGVSRAELWGIQPKVIYLDISEAKVAQLGISTETVLATLSSQNFVVNAGSVNLPDRRMRVEIKGEFKSPDDIGNVIVKKSALDAVSQIIDNPKDLQLPLSKRNDLIRIKDIGTVHLGYLEPMINTMRFNGKPALAISLANNVGGNIIETGANIDKTLEFIKSELPAGLKVDRFQWQSNLVEESISGFIINLAEAVLIVLIVLTIPMGWRMGLVIGSGLILTIFGTFVAMAIMDIQLHRISLGALVVALGMMVDNSIVVADGISVRLSQGMERKKAAIESATIPAWPLLGATVVASMAFFPVYSSPSSAGEYGRGLFVVVAISLAISWLLAVTVTPLHCMLLLKAPKNTDGNTDPYGGIMFSLFNKILKGSIRYRFLTIMGVTVILAASVYGFKNVPQQFFPDSTRAQFFIDYWAPEGTPIGKVSEDIKAIEKKLTEDERTLDIGSFIGSGGPRFYLPVDPEFPYASYAQIIVNTPSFAEVTPTAKEMEEWLNDKYGDVLIRVRKYTVGPGDTWPFEMRVSGPANADLEVLREIGQKGTAILKKSPLAKHVRTDMRQKVNKVSIDYSQERARWTSINRSNLAAGVLRSYDGYPIGLFRDEDDIYPIVVRSLEDERKKAAESLDLVQIKPSFSASSVPLSEVAENIHLEWEDPIIPRWNRRRQVAIQAQPNGVTFPALKASVAEEFKQLEAELPPGYEVYWDGEQKSTYDAQTSLLPGMVPTAVIIMIILVALFNAYKPMLIMFWALPFAAIGITGILLPTQTPFGFMALLGAMSLVGMMIKNSIVLLDEINLNLAKGLTPYDSVVQSAVSRLRPVVLAALTTVLGVLPLLQDAFWVSMAMTIMAGLTVGTAVTMVLVPVFYSTLYKVKEPKDSK